VLPSGSRVRASRVTNGTSVPERHRLDPHAGEAAPPGCSSVTPVPELNAVGIVTSDMARSLRFYRLLGLEVPDAPDEGHVDVSLPNGIRLMLDTEELVRGFRPDWRRATGNQLGLAFECDTPAEVDEVYERVTAAGFSGEKEPWDAFWGQRYAQLRDPDGVPVDLYAAL
jgi:catechol 2,3-dioxygenase-like lactoylglutathione lyase family enzyme